MTNINKRLDELEKQAKKANNGPAYITIQEGDEIPEGFTGKAYVGWGPDEWDDFDDDNGNNMSSHNTSEPPVTG